MIIVIYLAILCNIILRRILQHFIENRPACAGPFFYSNYKLLLFIKRHMNKYPIRFLRFLQICIRLKDSGVLHACKNRNRFKNFITIFFILVLFIFGFIVIVVIILIKFILNVIPADSQQITAPGRGPRR